MSVLDWFFTAFFIILYIFLSLHRVLAHVPEGIHSAGDHRDLPSFSLAHRGDFAGQTGSQYEIAERTRMQA